MPRERVDLSLVAEGTIEHRMIPLLANKQMLADGVLDGRGDLSEMPLPSGRKALPDLPVIGVPVPTTGGIGLMIGLPTTIGGR